MSGHIVSFGSINMDLVVRAPHLPKPGESLVGRTFFTAPGGKGANQAVAVARLGAHSIMIGRVGEDVFAETLRASLRGYGVDATHVATANGEPSGVALITVDDNAENNIVIVPGANNAFTDDDLTRLGSALQGAAALLIQLEVPLDKVIVAMQMAKQLGVTVILDPAPIQPLPESVYRTIDVITPNETEASALVGFAVSKPEDAARAAQELIKRGVQTAVIKMGSKGAFWQRAGEDGHFTPSFKVKAIDTVAAGDAFNGGLALALSEGRPFAEAIRWGCATGALSTTKAGAQPSMPSRAEVEQLMQEQG
jgi:ribokinase